MPKLHQVLTFFPPIRRAGSRGSRTCAVLVQNLAAVVLSSCTYSFNTVLLLLRYKAPSGKSDEIVCVFVASYEALFEVPAPRRDPENSGLSKEVRIPKQ